MEEQYRERNEQKVEKRSLRTKFKTFIKECIRVLKITKKPTPTEFKTIVKASAVGILVIGALGFTITMLKYAIK